MLLPERHEAHVLNSTPSSKPKTLFMQASSKNHEVARDVAAFEDIPKDSSKEGEAETKPEDV